MRGVQKCSVLTTTSPRICGGSVADMDKERNGFRDILEYDRGQLRPPIAFRKKSSLHSDAQCASSITIDKILFLNLGVCRSLEIRGCAGPRYQHVRPVNMSNIQKCHQKPLPDQSDAHSVDIIESPLSRDHKQTEGERMG